jgi:hypothetical protein
MFPRTPFPDPDRVLPNQSAAAPMLEVSEKDGVPVSGNPSQAAARRLAARLLGRLAPGILL